MPNQHLNPDGVSKPTGYTHVVSGQGRVVFIAGQVAANEAGEVVGEGDLAAQANQVFTNLKTCLASVGATFADVTKLTTFVVNYKPEDRAIVAAARAAHLPADNPPASTLVGVQALARPEFMIEIEATAVLPA
jgi:enamine deaminase RidA (YjgF/YER057c/UK114 family)